MRNKTIFWMLQIIMVLFLSATMANAQTYPLDVDPQITSTGQLINENLNDGTIDTNPASVCLICEDKDSTAFRIYYGNCEAQTDQFGTTVTGFWNAFDRDAALLFTGNASTSIQATGFDSAWYSPSLTATSTPGRSYVGYCQNATPNYLFAICNCVLKTQFLPGQDYVFEVEVIGDGVYWTNRNLSLLGDLGAGAYTATDPLLGGDPYGPYDDNVIRYVVGESVNFFCAETDDATVSGTLNEYWWEHINNDATGPWIIGEEASDYHWALGYAGVKDYITRNYNGADFDQSTCVPGRVPYNLTNNYGLLACPSTGAQPTTNPANAKILRTWPVEIFQTGYPVLSQTPYLYLDLPTMIYNPQIAELCDEVYVMITIALPFQGVCSNCCNLPMCSCQHFVGAFGCDEDECDPVIPEPTEYTKCLPYITHMLDDGWWDFIAVANMSQSSIAPVITFYADGNAANYPMPSIPAHSVAAVGLIGDISDYIAANYSGFPLTGEAMYAEVTVEGTDMFDAFSLVFHPDFGSSSYLARCNACGICSDCAK